MPLPSSDMTQMVFTSLFSKFLQVHSLLLLFYKTQNIITTETNKQLRFGFLYVMPYSIYFALIKKMSVLPVHFPHKCILSHLIPGVHPEKLMIFHDTACLLPNLKGLSCPSLNSYKNKVIKISRKFFFKISRNIFFRNILYFDNMKL